jgi:hypothetical protein
MLEPKGRHRGKTEQLRGLDPAVAGDDAVILVDEDGVVEAEGLDAGGDLLRRMRSCVAAVGLEIAWRTMLDRESGRSDPSYGEVSPQSSSGVNRTRSSDTSLTQGCRHRTASSSWSQL